MFVRLKKAFQGQQPGTQIDVSDADARTLCEAGVAEVIDGDPLGPLVKRSVENALGNLTGSLNQAVETTLRQFADAQSKSRKNAVPALFGPNGDGDPKRTFGSFLLAVRRNDHRALEAMGSKWVDWSEGKAAMTSQTGTAGGYAVPTEFLPKLFQYISEKAIVRQRAYKHPMRGQSVEIPYLDQVTAPAAGDSAYFGGFVLRWGEEASTLNESEPSVKQLKLVAHELKGYAYLSNTLLQDEAVGLEAILYQLMGDAVAWYEDYNFLRGDGAGKPLGAAVWSGALAITRNTANQFKLDDAAQMLSRLTPGWSPDTTCWAMHPYVQRYLWQMADAAGNVIYIDNARDRPRTMLFGIPVCVTEKLPALGTAKDVLLGDWSKYVVGDRQEVEIAFSEHYRFINNQGTWRVVTRLDGQPWMRDKVTLADAASTVSPFVYLN